MRRRTPSPRKLLAAAAAIALGAVLFVGCNMRARLEASMLYFPSREPFATPAGAEDVWLTAADGLRLHGWFLAPAGRSAPPPPYPTVIHVHGNAGNLEGHLAFSEFLRHHGFAVLLFDFRCYGRSDLSPRHLCREDLLTDTNAAIDHALARPDVDRRRLALYGFSLGGVIALAAASERPEIRAVVSVAAFSRWKDIAAHHAGFPGRLLMRSGLDAADAAARLGTRPLLLVHGDRDTIIPPAHARAIAQAADRAGVPVRILSLPDGHNDIVVDDPAAQRAIADFLRECLPPATDP